MERIKVGKIRTDGGTQVRAAINAEVVAQYAENLKALPPIEVYYDGTDYWLADGFHRLEAAKLIGAATIEAKVKRGTVRDAILAACGANSEHGLPRTNLDKRRAVMTLLEDEEWTKWSDREIARRCGVGHPFVGSLRPILESDSSMDTDDAPTRTFIHHKTGKPAVMNTANIGRKPSGSNGTPTHNPSTPARMPRFKQATNEAETVWLWRDDIDQSVEMVRHHFNDDWCERFARALLAASKEAQHA